jgi:hypothetical protein
MSDPVKPLDPNLLLEASRVMNQAGKEFAVATRLVSDWALQNQAKATPEIRAGIVGDAAALRLRTPGNYTQALDLLSDIGTSQCPDPDGRLHILRALARGQEYTAQIRSGKTPAELAKLAQQIRSDLATAFATDKTGKLKEDNQGYWNQPESADPKTQATDSEDDLKAVYEHDPEFKAMVDPSPPVEKKPDAPPADKAAEPPSPNQPAPPPVTFDEP